MLGSSVILFDHIHFFTVASSFFGLVFVVVCFMILNHHVIGWSLFFLKTILHGTGQNYQLESLICRMGTVLVRAFSLFQILVLERHLKGAQDIEVKLWSRGVVVRSSSWL